MSLRQDLLNIEQKFWAGGPEIYRRYADKDCLVAFTEMAGTMANEDIAKTAEPGRWHDVSMNVKGLKELSPESAVLTYECEAKRKDGKPYHALVSSGYVKRPEGWKLAFHQQTPLH